VPSTIHKSFPLAFGQPARIIDQARPQEKYGTEPVGRSWSLRPIPQVLGDHTVDCSLAQKKCVPCGGGVQPLEGKSLEDLAAQIDSSWQVIQEHHLWREFRLPDFRSALELVNRLGQIAEAEGHHPDIELSWGRVAVKIFTHKIDGLTESDFVLAAKYDQCWEQFQAGRGDD